VGKVGSRVSHPSRTTYLSLFLSAIISYQQYIPRRSKRVGVENQELQRRNIELSILTSIAREVDLEQSFLTALACIMRLFNLEAGRQ
jgi:hypothetical protein